MRKQLLWLMYILSRNEDFLRVPNRVTRSVDKIVFKVPAKISLTYERSPYYVGTKLWDELPKAIQDCGDIYAFKKEIAKMIGYMSRSSFIPVMYFSVCCIHLPYHM